MAEAILDLRLDTVQPNRVRLVYGVQNDYNSRYICARFTANGKPMDIEKTAAVRINAKRPDGKKDAFPGTVNADGTAKVPVAQWMLEVPGEVSASITAVTTSGALTTQEFYIMAKASLWDSTGQPDPENPDKDVLQTIIASENERVAAESTRVANENARKSAETARATAETKRIADEATRVVNEAGRVSAEEIRREEFATWQDEWGKISSFDKRLENLEAAVSPEIVTPVTDSTVAYTKTVPNGAMPNAAVCEVGGMSYKCENLISFPYGDTTVTRNGITWTVNADGSVTANGTATSDSNFNLKKYGYDDFIKLNVGEACTLSGYPSSGLGKGYIIIQDISYKQDALTEGTATTFTPKYNSYYMQIKILSGKTVSNLVIRPMLNKGTTALPYQPYFTGLRDSKVTAIESVGANMFGGDALADKLVAKGNAVKDEVNKTVSYTAENVSNVVLYDKFKENTRYTFFLYGYNEQDATLPNMSVDYTDGTTDTLQFYEGVVYYISKAGKTIKSFRGNWNIGQTVLYYEKCGVFKGYVANENFAPYFRESLPIPGDALDGWGQGVNAQYCNKIVLDPLEGVKKYVTSAKKVIFDGSDDETIVLGQNGENNSLFNISIENGFDYSPAIANIDIPYKVTYDTSDEHWYISVDFFTIVISNYKANTVAQLRTYLNQNPITCVYGIATTETDVSAYFTDDNLLSVEAGGTITAVNEYEQAVPFTIEYTVKGA